jgi:carboxymethylenebutenolidase
MSTSQPDGYLAAPESGTGRGVLVLHAWWGLNQDIREFCDRLASEGYLVFAPDLYRGKLTSTIAGAESLSSALDADRARADALQALEFLSERVGTGDSLAVLGFSLGAYFALDLSTRAPDRVSKVILYYGTGPADFENSRASYLGHFAEQDPYEPIEYVQALEQALKLAGREVRFEIYPATGHWFAEPGRKDAFDSQAANLSWQRTLEFLK